jgi:hypothetical protein
MVKDLFATPAAAQDSDVFAFASDVDADQRIEIARMSAMLKESSEMRVAGRVFSAAALGPRGIVRGHRRAGILGPARRVEAGTARRRACGAEHGAGRVVAKAAGLLRSEAAAGEPTAPERPAGADSTVTGPASPTNRDRAR